MINSKKAFIRIILLFRMESCLNNANYTAIAKFIGSDLTLNAG